jgi:phage terminase large subunit-like protein
MTPASQYAHNVVGGEIPACRFAKLACQRQIDDRKRWPALSAGEAKKLGHPYYFDKKAAERVCNFIEKLPHTKGRWASKQECLKLEPWQQFRLSTVFGWKRTDNGKRRFRKAYNEIPRKNGKSCESAGLGLYMFCADEEFGAEVYSGATTEKQAWEVFRPAHLMVKRTAPLQEYFGIEANASNLAIQANGSRFEPLIGKPGDGASPSCAIHDEFHEHQTSEQADAMETGMGAREQPLQWFITTAGDNLGGPCYDLRRYAIEVLEGRLDNPELFAIIYTIDEGDDWTTEAALRKANPNFDISVGADFLLSRQREAKQSARKQNAFRTKHLNTWVGARQAFLNMVRWNACPKAKSLEELVGRRCFIGMDLASKIDIAAVDLLFPPVADDPLWHLHTKFYLPEDRVETAATTNAGHYDAWAKMGFITLTPGNVIDFEFIEQDLKSFKVFGIAEIGFDPWQATQLATRMLAEGLPMVEVGQNVRNFSEPMKQLEALVLQGKLAHPHNPVLSWMAANVVAKLDAKDNIYPRKESEESKIDGVVALIIALGRALADSDKTAIIGKDYELVWV